MGIYIHICVRFYVCIDIYIYVYFFEDIYIYIYPYVFVFIYLHIDIFYITDFNLCTCSYHIFPSNGLLQKMGHFKLDFYLLELLLFADSIEIEMLTNPCPRIHDVRPALLSLQT